jgi:hypothetical protein
MKFQIGPQGWPIGGMLIPASTVIDLTKPEGELSDWEKLARGHPLPMDAGPLDDEAYAELVRAHGMKRSYARPERVKARNGPAE